MAQNTVLAAGTTAAVSTDIVIAAGAEVIVGVFSSVAANMPLGARFNILLDTPGSDQFIAKLDNEHRAQVLTGPGTYRVSRNAYTGAAFGVFSVT